MSAEERAFTFTDRDFNCIRKLVSEHTGIALGEAKRDMVYSRLTRRLRQLGLDDFRHYCELLLAGEDEEELVHFTNSVTTNLTSFFREQHHFRYLADELLPRIRRSKGHEKRLRIWSAGCSSGEEPYSLAMTIREVLSSNSGWDVKILATDLDTNVLSRAANGVYDEERIKDLPSTLRRRWFMKGKGEQAGSVRVLPELQEMISFKRLNLLKEWPMRGPFDFIFCRNVVIYFDKPTQKVLLDRFADMLDTDGHLFMGHSESLYKVTNRFKLLGNTIYAKTT